MKHDILWELGIYHENCPIFFFFTMVSLTRYFSFSFKSIKNELYHNF